MNINSSDSVLVELFVSCSDWLPARRKYRWHSQCAEPACPAVGHV